MAIDILHYVLRHPKTEEWLKHKAHDWLPAFFSRHDLTPEENLLIDQKNALQTALMGKDLGKLAETLDLFPHLINQPLNNGEIPITFAVKQNLQDKIDLLLERGADPTCKDRIGLNALDIALQTQEKELFAKLIANKLGTIADTKQFIHTLDGTIVSGSAAKSELKNLEADAKKARAELEKIQLPLEDKALLHIVLKGDFVQFKQKATLEKVTQLAEKLEGDQLFQAAILGSPLILDALLSMGHPFSERSYLPSQHPMRFAFCSRHPVEAYIPLFSKFQFDIHALASEKDYEANNSYAQQATRFALNTFHSLETSLPSLSKWNIDKALPMPLPPTKEKVTYFDLLVYQKKQNSQNMDPLAVTGWDIAFATFSLLSFAANYQYLPLPQSATPWVRTGLNAANYLQCVSLLLFKLSYSREGKLGAAFQQLMTHYVVSLFMPVRIYYASMTVYSALKTCLEHKYRSYGDLCKKMIVQLPATAEIAHHTYDTVTPYLKGLYNQFFGIVETRNYNWNMPSSQSPKTKRNSKPTSTAIETKTSRPMLENTPFMKAFGESTLKTHPTTSTKTRWNQPNENTGIIGQRFNNDIWLYEGQVPMKSTTVSGAIELGKDFHQESEWFKNAIQGTPLEQAYRNTHLQAAAAGELKEFRNGFSIQGGFRVDFTGLSAAKHFVETIAEGGARFEKINSMPEPKQLPNGS